VLRRIEKDFSLQECLKKRKIDVDVKKRKELLVIPIKDENLKLSGSLEVYVNALAN